MSILVKMPKISSHAISHFSPKCAKFLRELVIKKWNAWYSIYIGCIEKILPWANMQFKITIIKFSFFLVGSPKKVGYPNFKNSYLFNRKEPRHVPPIVWNIMTRDISPWWVYLKSHVPIPLKYTICLGCQRPHKWGCKRPYHQLQEFQSLLQHIKERPWALPPSKSQYPYNQK